MNLISMIPFLDEEELNELMNKIISSGKDEYNGISIYVLLPFLTKNSLNELMEKIIKNEVNFNYQALLPFLEREEIEKMFFEAVTNKKDFVSYLPFLSEETYHEIALKYCHEEIELPIELVYPFMNESDIKMIFKYVLSKDNGQ